MLFITLGDPYSISIPILHRLLATPRPYPRVVIGSAWHWQEQTQDMPLLTFTPLASLAETKLKHGLYFYDCGQPDLHVPTTSLTPQQRGTLACAALDSLHSLPSLLSANTPKKYAVLTCPIDKHACAAAGFKWRGQTEFFAHLYHCATVMVLSSSELNVGLVTNHLAIRELPAALTTELVLTKLKLFAHTLSTLLSRPQPRIAVCGFNPHCGDRGLYGDEDEKIITPAIATAQQQVAATITGPHAADSIFYPARTGTYDGVLAIYHDQGLAPLKACAAYDAVNISGGLPLLRIAPDHGPAADLYGQDSANTQSFVRCFKIIDTYLK